MKTISYLSLYYLYESVYLRTHIKFLVLLLRISNFNIKIVDFIGNLGIFTLLVLIFVFVLWLFSGGLWEDCFDSSSLQFDPKIERTCKANRRQVIERKKAKIKVNIEMDDMNPIVVIEEVVDDEQKAQVPRQ